MRLPALRPAALMFGAGALAALGHAPLYLWPLTLLGLAVVLRMATKGVWLGLLGGMGYGAVALSWITEPFMVEAETYGWMAPFALFFMALGLGIFWAAATWASRRALGPTRYGLAVALTATEYLRGHILTGFPWAMPGHVWISTPVAQLGAFVGPTGLTLATLLLAAALSELRPRPALTAALGLGALWAYGLSILSHPMPPNTGATLRLVQPNAEQRLKWDATMARTYFDRLLAATAAAPKPDLVIWPETSLPYLLDRHPELALMISEAAQGVPVALGAQRSEGPRFWNSLTVITAGGAIGPQYDKHHLVPFGEYVPLGDLTYDLFAIGAFASKEGAGYTAGPGAAVLDFGPKLGRALPLICYEAVFPQDVNAAPERADWLLQITNDAWFGTLSGPFQHADQARMRAIEQGLPLVRVANTGVTAVYDARGRITASLPFGVEAHLDTALPGPLPPTVFSRFGEIPALVLLAGLGLFLFRRQNPKFP